MSEGRLPLSVRDRCGGLRRGAVLLYGDRASRLPPLEPPAEFRIVLLARQRRVGTPADATVICVPAGPSSRTALESLPSRLSALRLDEEQMEAYRSGDIVSAIRIGVHARDVFPAGGNRPDVRLLARAVVDALDAEKVAAYTGTLRHELRIPAGQDALRELALRLAPPDASERPPRRAPGISRLHRSLDCLRRHVVPDVPLEQFVEDLRLLRLFAPDDPWPQDAMHRLLADVQPRAAQNGRTRALRAVPMRRPRTR